MISICTFLKVLIDLSSPNIELTITGSHSNSQAAQVLLDPKEPILVLEDVQDHVHSIACQGTSVLISFHDEHTLEAAVKEWETAYPFLLITSDPRCAPQGEYGVFVWVSLQRSIVGAFDTKVVYLGAQSRLIRPRLD
jgi:hypothetical protein